MAKDKDDHLALTSKIVSAFVANNEIKAEELTGVISTVHSTLNQLGIPNEAPQRPNVSPAVPISKSVHDDHLVCLDCGRKMKTLKRHLNAYHNLSPKEYRQRWGLSADYPIVAVRYSKERTKLALESKFGHTYQ